MKKYTDPDPLHGNGKATIVARKKIQPGDDRKIPFYRVPFDRDNYICGHDGRAIRKHLPVHRRASRRALARQAQ